MKRLAVHGRNNVHFWFLLLLFASLILRLFLIFTSNPGIQNDSPSYITLAHQIASLNLTGDTGFRTPIYPLFIILFNFDPALIRIGQTVLGLITLSMLFWCSWRLTRNAVVAFVVGGFYGFNLAQIYFESQVLTETLTTFWVVACLYIFFQQPEVLEGKRFSWWVVGVGVISALAALTRPLFLFLPLLLAIVLFAKLGRNSPRNRLWLATMLFLPGFFLVGSWSLFNYFRIGYFGPSTFTGLGLADHTITFIQYAPDQYAAIRDVYMNARANEGTNVVNVWEGIEQAQNATGESFVQLSKTLTQMSLYLIVRHPILYLESVAVTWIRFWNEPGWWTWPTIPSPSLQIIVAYAWRVEKYILVFLQNLPFLVLTAFFSVRWVLKKPKEWLSENFQLSLLTAVVIITSIVQALVERGDVTRYAIPVQPLESIVVVVGVWKIWQLRKGSHPSLN